jgi:hypothetical protein
MIQNGIDRALNINPMFYRLNKNTKDKQSGYWWLRSQDGFEQQLTFSEQLELFTYTWYLREKRIPEHLFYQQAAAQFPGLFSPSEEELLDCLQAYGIKADDGHWQFADVDEPSQRERIIADIIDKLVHLGKEHQFKVKVTAQNVCWLKEQTQYSFHIINTGICSPFLPVQAHETDLTGPSISIIFPGSKAKLVHHRLDIDPRYQMAASNCHLIKFRHIIRILEDSQPNLEFFLQSLDEDKPGLQDIRQMSLFSSEPTE